MTESNEHSFARRWLLRAWKLVQWPLSIFLLVGVIALAFGSGAELAAPGAPVTAYYAALAVFAVVSITMLPPVFFRMPAKVRGALYAALLVTMSIAGHVIDSVEEAYDRTPEGKRQLAQERAEEERAAVNERNLQQQVEAQERAQASRDLAASKERTCRELVAAITDLAQSEQGIDIFEVNDISVSDRVSDTKPVTCFGDAITSRGELSVTYGLETTPQGQTLVTMRLR